MKKIFVFLLPVWICFSMCSNQPNTKAMDTNIYQTCEVFFVPDKNHPGKLNKWIDKGDGSDVLPVKEVYGNIEYKDEKAGFDYMKVQVWKYVS
jgi:hypothetical protein